MIRFFAVVSNMVRKFSFCSHFPFKEVTVAEEKLKCFSQSYARQAIFLMNLPDNEYLHPFKFCKNMFLAVYEKESKI